jgi:hypothetical protein
VPPDLHGSFCGIDSAYPVFFALGTKDRYTSFAATRSSDPARTTPHNMDIFFFFLQSFHRLNRRRQVSPNYWPYLNTPNNTQSITLSEHP